MYKPKIRWKTGEKEYLQKRINNYNQKIWRLKREGYDTSILPETINYKKQLTGIQHREQLKTTHKLIDAFTKYGSHKKGVKSERGAFIPEYVQQQTKIKLGVINKERRNKKTYYENMPITDRNKKLGVEGVNFKNAKIPNLTERKVNFKNMSRKDLKIFLETLGEYDTPEEEKMEMYRDNLYKAIGNVFEGKAKNLTDILDKIPTQTIVDKYYTDINMDIDFVYLEIDLNLRYETLIESWNSVLKEFDKK